MRRSPLLVMTAVLALSALTGCSDDADEKAAAPAASSGAEAVPSPEPTVSLDMPDNTAGVPKPDPTEPNRDAVAQVQAVGAGPYEVGETQADLTEAKLLGPVVDAAGCATTTGTSRFTKPEVFLAGGKVVMVKATQGDPWIGRPLAEAQAEFEEGKAVSGSGGAQGWQIVEETNALIYAATGGTINAVLGGVTASVEKHFTSGSGC
jgi:hypothetical protein